MYRLIEMFKYEMTRDKTYPKVSLYGDNVIIITIDLVFMSV